MKTIKDLLKTILHQEAGKRFIFAYLKINHMINHNIFMKSFLFTIGIILFFLGVIMLFIPGPGLLFILAGSFLLCIVSKHIANFLDKMELNGRKLKERYWKKR